MTKDELIKELAKRTQKEFEQLAKAMLSEDEKEIAFAHLQWYIAMREVQVQILIEQIKPIPKYVSGSAEPIHEQSINADEILRSKTDK